MSASVGHPIFVDLRDAPVVVIGGGAVAERKVLSLLESGARVTVVAPRATETLRELAGGGAIRFLERAYAAGDLDGVRLAYAATDDPAVNRAVHAEATRRGVWLNVADRPALCTFLVPAVVRRGELTVAVSTNGASPAMARRIREDLERTFGAEHAAALVLLRRLRERLQAEPDGIGAAREALQGLAGPALIGALAAGDRAAVDALLLRELGPGWTLESLGLSGLVAEAAAGGPGAGERRVGRVYLVGAGPGDPGLITLKGKACLEASEVIVYDALVDKGVLEYARPGAMLVYAGKREGNHSRPQEEINALLIQYARIGLTVTRLKGGDPFLFGRGGEEALALVEAGIPFEVVPGVSAGLAVPAYAGIPVTHRHLAAAVTFVTGHERTDRDVSAVRWDNLGPDHGTLVFFMGVRNLPDIARKLVENGRPAHTPAAVIEWGTTDRQASVVGTLADIASRAQAAGVAPPALIVVGEVVALREQLRWFPEPWSREGVS